MSSSDPDNNLTSADLKHLHDLEIIARRSLNAYVEVAAALAEIRDTQLYRGTHTTFEAYLRERWGLSDEHGRELAQVAKLWEEALSLVGDDGVTVADVRVVVHKRRHSIAPVPEPRTDPSSAADLADDKLLPQLRWLLTQSAGSIAHVAHQLETRAADVDEHARDQLRDDVLFLDEELATLKARLIAPTDWDAEYEQLLAGEIPPLERDADEDDD
jgi:hypothetical protein